jgi:hypothetical protein
VTEGSQHADRNVQYRYLNDIGADYLDNGQPATRMDEFTAHARSEYTPVNAPTSKKPVDLLASSQSNGTVVDCRSRKLVQIKLRASTSPAAALQRNPPAPRGAGHPLQVDGLDLGPHTTADQPMRCQPSKGPLEDRNPPEVPIAAADHGRFRC